MPENSRSAAAVWSDPQFAAAWLAADPRGGHDLLELPRRIAAALIAEETPQPRLVVDVASGPGTFLAVLLETFPDARGIWFDVSPAMLARAREELAGFGDRVEFLTGDMSALREAGVPGGVDALVTSRASHHLPPPGLHAFYREAAGLLAPGGWLVNLDHVGLEQRWDRLLRTVRKRFSPPRTGASTHHHDAPLPTAGDHLDGYRAAGITDVELTWKAFYSCLFTGRAAGR